MHFSSSSYGCVKNPKKFLWLKWFGFHDFEITNAKPWGFDKWAVNVRCTHCGITDYTFGISKGELAVTQMKVSEEVRKTRGDLFLREATNE